MDDCLWLDCGSAQGDTRMPLPVLLTHLDTETLVELTQAVVRALPEVLLFLLSSGPRRRAAAERCCVSFQL